MKIYVGNLNYKVQDEDLQKIFEDFGNVVSAKVMVDRETGRNRGFGFVEMGDDSEAQRAIEELNDGELMGRKLVVNEARPQKTSSGPRGGGGGFNRRNNY